MLYPAFPQQLKPRKLYSLKTKLFPKSRRLTAHTSAPDVAMESSRRLLRVGVIGPAGFGGSYLCVELINRGHHVVGFSRNPDKLGTHPRYTPVILDVGLQTIEQLAEAFVGVDVLVNEYGPHSAGHEALQYSMTQVRGVRTSCC